MAARVRIDAATSSGNRKFPDLKAKCLTVKFHARRYKPLDVSVGNFALAVETYSTTTTGRPDASTWVYCDRLLAGPGNVLFPALGTFCSQLWEPVDKEFESGLGTFSAPSPGVDRRQFEHPGRHSVRPFHRCLPQRRP